MAQKDFGLRKQLHKYILLFTLCFGSASGFSQSGGIDFEDAYEPDSLYAVRNAFKFDVAQIIFGDLQLYYERILKAGWSVELGAGITRRNYAVGLNDYSLDNLGRNVDIKTGYAASLSIRKYMFPTDELNGLYISLTGSIKDYKTDYQVIDSAGNLTDFSFRDQRKHVSGSLNLGYQLLPVNSNFFLDGYLGVAYHHEDFHVVRTENEEDPNAYFITHDVDNDFALSFGLRIGYGF